MNFKKILHYFSLLICVALIATCFIPWVHYNSINETFTGYNVKKFATGVYYGRAGLVITYFVAAIILLTLLPYIAAKRANMFVCALLVAYTLRTYVIFTGAMFDGEVEKLSGIYLIVLLSLILVVCSVFPYLKKEETF
jgi:hypothetical protein